MQALDIQQIVMGGVNWFLLRDRGSSPLTAGWPWPARFNPSSEKRWIGRLRQFIDNATMLSIILTGVALIRERDEGAIGPLRVMPVTPAQIMLAPVWSMGLVAPVAAGAWLNFVAPGRRSRGAGAMFLVRAALCRFATTTKGLKAAVARSTPRFAMLLILILIPLRALFGVAAPREGMPASARNLMSAAPTTHFVELGQSILYRTAGFSVVRKQFLALPVIGSALFSLLLRRFHGAIGQTA